MKYKQKKIQLTKAKLQAHPQLRELIKNDVVNLKVNHCIGELPIEVIQTLLDLNPLKFTSLILVNFSAILISNKMNTPVIVTLNYIRNPCCAKD